MLLGAGCTGGDARAYIGLRWSLLLSLYHRLNNAVDCIRHALGRQIEVVRENREGELLAMFSGHVSGKALHAAQRPRLRIDAALQVEALEAVGKRAINA